MIKIIIALKFIDVDFRVFLFYRLLSLSDFLSDFTSYNACAGRSDRRRAEEIMISQTDNESKQLQTEMEDYYE